MSLIFSYILLTSFNYLFTAVSVKKSQIILNGSQHPVLLAFVDGLYLLFPRS